MMTNRDTKTKKRLEAGDDAGFLGRWSRRKAEARTAEVLPKNDTESGMVESEEGPPTPDDVDRPAFDIESLPDIDSLGPTSDFSVFMQTGVPADLKTKALRKLWRVKSELANLDGLIDYGEDLTGSFKVVDHLKTAYEVGRGFLQDDQEQKDNDNAAVSDDDVATENETTTNDKISAETTEKVSSSPVSDADDVAKAGMRNHTRSTE